MVGALAACGGGSDSGSGDSASSKPTKAATSKTPSGEATPNIVTDSVMTGLTCEPDEAGVWTAQMDMTNSSDTEAVYAARVAVENTKTSELMGRKTIRVTLAAGESATVPFEELALGEPADLACDPRVVLIED